MVDIVDPFQQKASSEIVDPAQGESTSSIVDPFKTNAATKQPSVKIIDPFKHDDPEDKPTALEQAKQNTVSFASREFVAAADTLLNIGDFAASTGIKSVGMAAKGLGVDPKMVDDTVKTAVDITHKAIADPVKKAVVGMGMDKETIEGNKIDKVMAGVGNAKQALDQSIADATHTDVEKVSLSTDAAMLGIGELFGRLGVKEKLGAVADKTGITEAIDKLTDPTGKEMFKYEETKAKLNKDFEQSQLLRKERFERDFVGPKADEIKVKQSQFEQDVPNREAFKSKMDEIFKDYKVDPDTGEVFKVDPAVEAKRISDARDVKAKADFEAAAKELGKTPKELEQHLKDTGAKWEYVGDEVAFDNLKKSLTDFDKVIKDTTNAKQPEPIQITDALVDWFKKNKRQVENARQFYFEQSGLAPVKGVLPDFKRWEELIKDDIGIHISALDIARTEYSQVAKGLRKLAAGKGELDKVWRAIQEKTVDALPDHLKAAAVLYDTQMKRWGLRFMDSGIIKGMLEDYATRMIDMHGVDPKLIDKLLSAFSEKQAASMSTKSKYGKTRLIDEFAELESLMKEYGLKFKTTNLAEITEAYGESMFKAMLNKKLIDTLGKYELKDGSKVFIKRDDKGRIPFGFKELRGGMYDGFWVHPDIASPLKFVMDQREMGMVMRGLSALSGITKRINVGLSMFHATTLTVGRMFALGAKDNFYYNPIKQFKELSKAYENAYSQNRLQQWQKSNLKLGAETDSGIGIMGQLAKSGDTFLRDKGGLEGDYLAKTVNWAGKPQAFLDKMTWDIVHDGSKLLTAEALLEKAKLNHPKVSEQFLRDQIATHVNDVYGGIDWYGAARDSNKYLEKLKMNMFSPEGRKYLQILEFAPDWTLSTVRVFARTIPKNILKPTEWNISEGLAGLVKPLTAADHARQYQMRAAVALFTVANGLNISLSGHPIWENKEFFSIELGDGSAIHPFKHYAESWHWLGNFAETFKNKLGFIPRMAYETRDKGLAEGLQKLAESSLPFTFSGGKKGIAEAVSGFAGLPVTGTHEGQLGGKGLIKNWQNIKNRAEKRLGMKIKTTDDEEE